MQRILSLFLCATSVAALAHAQERKIEISPFAGGYFSTGFQSYEALQLTSSTLSLNKTTPVNEPNSGIFGVRASYDLTPRVAIEGTFGFSPAGRGGCRPVFISSVFRHSWAELPIPQSRL